MQLEQKFRDTISRYNLLNKNDTVIVAVSGGPDSVCLLILLNQLKHRFGLHLHVAIFNHLIRKQQAREDVEFVKVLGRRNSLPVTAGEADVPKFAKLNKLSLEEAARLARFAFLKEVAVKNKAAKIALGHNLDDQIETFLMRLIRGAGLEGLCGMSALRKEKNFEIIRPLIEISRSQIEEFLKQKKIKFRVDRTNESCEYFRNRIRLKLIPLLEKEYNPNIKESVLRASHNIKEVCEFLTGEVEARSKKAICRKGEEIFLDLRNFKSYPWIIKTHLLRRAVLELKGNLRQLNYENWLSLQKLASESQSGRRLLLPDGIVARKIYNNLIFGKKPVKKEFRLPERKKINYYGSTRVEELGIEICAGISNVPPKGERKSKWIEFFDADRIQWPIFIRTRREKDEFRPLGMGGKKTLKEFFIDEKIPLTLRNNIPIIEDRRRIIWVAGCRISDEVKITQQTKRMLRLEIKKI